MSAIIKAPIDELATEVKLLKEEIKELYLGDDRIMSLGFSGGKDSSLVLAITLEVLMELPKNKLSKSLHVLYSDTLMELLPVQSHTYGVLDALKKFASANDLPIKVIHAKPSLENTMWSMMIGKGIRASSTDNRWCTTRLKTDVQQRMLVEAFGTEDFETVSIVGSRKDESADRAKRLAKNTIKGHLKGHSVYAKSLVFAPIEDFSTDDVWTSLFHSKLGRDLLKADELYALYASTGGEGEECQTILGNANKNGVNPGCGASNGRFGCWQCPLQQGKDKALIGLAATYPYIRHLIKFRDWVVSTRDGQWEVYRDVYNHKDFTRLVYNKDNHRFGMTSPGGMSVEARKEMLERLLDTECKVNKSVEFQLISDEELNFIQHRWILEGDYSLSAKRIAKKYNREVEVSDGDKELIALSIVLYESKSTWESKLAWWYNIYPDKRFAIQFVKQLIEKSGHNSLLSVLQKASAGDDTIVAQKVGDLQVRKQFYPSPSLEASIRREWKNDEISFVTKALINDYEGWGDKEPHEDPLEDASISMQDKYDMLDNWNYYQNYDTNERFEHPEYMMLGGNTQYIKFRKRQTTIQKEKEDKRQARISRMATKAKTTEQLAFSF